MGPLKGKEVFVASAVCQKQRISFDQLCERMAEDSTVGQADVAAILSMAVRLAHSAPHSRQKLLRKFTKLFYKKRLKTSCLMRMFPHQGLFALYEQSYYLRPSIAISY